MDADWGSEAGGWATVAAVYAGTYALSAALPGRAALGYALRHGSTSPAVHTLNGVAVLAAVVAVAGVGAACGWLPGGALAGAWHAPAARAACAFGLALSLALYARGARLASAGLLDRRASCPVRALGGGGGGGDGASDREGDCRRDGDAGATAVVAVSTATALPSRRTSPRRAPAPKPSLPPPPSAATPDTSEFDARGAAAHFYCGLSEFNPVGPLGVDVKMWLYLAGAAMLQLNVASGVWAAAAAAAGGARPTLADVASLNPGQLAYAGCLTWFVVEYVWHEEVHLYTYDLFRERVGLKLAWGCLFFYPFFYAVGLWPLLAPGAARVSPAAAAACVALFTSGWVLTRGANLQKFACKQGRGTFAWGLVPMRTVPGSRGRLLASGFWGVSRHVNYLGEVLQAVALALPGWFATGSVLPWAYPAYYVALFVPRALDDDAQCAAKYGAAVWGAYTRAVPWRIVPGVW